jgi:recombination protein RecR
MQQPSTRLPDSIELLITELAKLPGIGRRTAQRLAFHLVRADDERSIRLARAIDAVRERVIKCEKCFGFSETPVCATCSDPRRDSSIVCVVEEPTDALLVESTGEFRGLYHVLGGALSPIEGIDPDSLRIRELVARIDRDGVREVIVATNPTMTGEATASYISDQLRGRAKVTRLASGLPVGVDLDQADDLTIGRAFAGRRELA